MPNRYEREIEEILRNMDQPESKSRPGSGQKFGKRFDREANSRMRMRQPRLTLTLSSSERLLLIAIGAALIGGGYAYLRRPDIISVVFALASVICLIVLIASQFQVGSPHRSRSVQYGNVTITPLRRDPLSTLRTRWNLFKLRMHYRRKKEK
jgi:hypothetical protein